MARNFNKPLVFNTIFEYAIKFKILNPMADIELKLSQHIDNIKFMVVHSFEPWGSKAGNPLYNCRV